MLPDLDFWRTLPGRAVLVSLALVALCAFAVFNNGAYFQNAMTLCVAGAWMIVLVLLLTHHGEIVGSWTRENWLIIATVAAFWCWVGLTMIWSISRDMTWVEFNRTGGYLAVLIVGLEVGRYRQARRLAAVLFLGIVTAAALYGLAAKAFPAHVDNLDNLGRLAVPLGYFNAVGLLMAMGFVLSLYVAAARDFQWWLRICASTAAPLILICLFFAVSRGATLALTVGLAVYFVVVPLRLRSFFIAVSAAVPALLIALWSNSQSVLMNDRIPLGERLLAASSLRWYLLMASLFCGLVLSLALLTGARMRVPSKFSRVAGATIIALLAVSAITGMLFFIGSKPSFTGWASDAYQSFRYSSSSEYGAGRLFEISSSGRWQLWEEAMANLREHPFGGTGGQTFPLIHLRLRESSNSFVKQPHGHPFQLLAELGLVGFLLGIAFIVESLLVSTRLVCALRDRWERSLAGAILAMIVVYLVHAGYDWDWNVFALTMAWFYFTGILLGWRGAKKREEQVPSGRQEAAS